MLPHPRFCANNAHRVCIISVGGRAHDAPRSAMQCEQTLTPSVTHSRATSLAEGGVVYANNAHYVRIHPVGELPSPAASALTHLRWSRGLLLPFVICEHGRRNASPTVFMRTTHTMYALTL